MTIPPPELPPVPDVDWNVEIGPHYSWWAVVIVISLFAAPVGFLIWTCATGGCVR